MGTIATRMAFGQELIEIAKTNENFVVCNADTKTCGLEKFGKLFPNREFSFGIAEQNLVGASAGLAACGNKVFLATFAVFASMRACEQVRTFVCYPNLNVTVIGTHAGLQVGGDGATHAAIEDVAIMRAFPNMTVVQPADAVAAKALAHAGLKADQVTFTEAELDWDDGKQVYDIEFYTADFKEYDYEIDAKTGEVLEVDYDAESFTPPASSGTVITREKAQEIALAKVPGADASHIKKLKLDKDDGKQVYDVEIIYNGAEHEMEIDAVTGKILEYEMDRD